MTVVALVLAMAFVPSTRMAPALDAQADGRPLEPPTPLAHRDGDRGYGGSTAVAGKGAKNGGGDHREGGGPPCEHPYPCEEVWPEGLSGPFELREVKHVLLESHDGVQLEGWVGIPDLPKGVRAPVALTSSPYLGFCSPLAGPTLCNDTPDQARFWSDEPEPGAIRNWGIIPIELVRHGFAAAFFNVRGTGNSGGCLDMFGEDEQRDQKVIVEWLADQDENPWSNGRVGMGGMSYRAGPPVEAAVQNLTALKTIVVAGTIFDTYTTIFTPQGAMRLLDEAIGYSAPYLTWSWVPPGGGGPEHATGEHLAVVPERACPQVVDTFARGNRDWLADQRDAAFWAERSFLDDLPDVTASILLAQGFRDGVNHGFQDSPVWSLASQAPKRQITGQWAHAFPWPEVATFDPAWAQPTWADTLFAWLDYWLKGEGAPPRLGTADYQDVQGTWHASTAWPPAEATDEVLYLSGDELSATPAGGDRTSRPLPTPLNARRSFEWNNHPYQPWAALCPDPVSASMGAAGLAYVSEPLTAETLLAGNPFAYLKLSSDQPGGTVRVQVAEIPPEGVRCDAAGQPVNVRVLTAGAADLRFHAGGFTGRDFPTGAPEHVRIDLWDMAETLSAASRLAVVIMGAEPVDEWVGQPYQPELTVHAGDVDSSQIVLPVVSGTVGAAEPHTDFPPRPFIPPTGRRTSVK